MQMQSQALLWQFQMDVAAITLLKVDAQLTDFRLAGIDMHILLQLRVPGKAFDGAALRPGKKAAVIACIVKIARPWRSCGRGKRVKARP